MSSKQAVVIIHGIGEQKPMGTLRDFVHAVWTTDQSLRHTSGESLWSKPDRLSKSFELRRLTTSEDKDRVRTDFFEFYWAHMMEGTSYGHVAAWAKTLLMRKPGTVPAQLKALYWLLIALLGIAGAVAVWLAFHPATGKTDAPSWLSWLVSLFILPSVGFIVLKCMGDAARYLNVDPSNVKSRHEIRKAGIDLLRQLHEPERDYSRIVLVGHSLGSVIGYDMLTHAWDDFNQDHIAGADLPPSLDDLERLAADPNPPIDEVQRLQREYHRELAARGCRWRVTDFVTMGSPLAHAAILMAHDLEDLRSKQAQREFPTCLPTLEESTRNGQKILRFSFHLRSKAKGAYRAPNHAAVFAATRWTNLYFPCKRIVWGDLIGGPLQETMGRGVKDVPVETDLRGGLFTHTAYWTPSEGKSPIEALREALNLRDR